MRRLGMRRADLIAQRQFARRKLKPH